MSQQPWSILDIAKLAGAGAIAGAILTSTVGFKYFDWHTDGQAAERARLAGDAAITRVLTPVCVDEFRSSPDVAKHIAALQKADSWRRDEVVRSAVKIPGQNSLDYALSTQCAEELLKPKSAEAK